MLLPLPMLLFACQRAPAQAPAAQRVLLSTDVATGLRDGWRPGVSDIDDGLAALMALNDPRLEVAGVALTYGNNDLNAESVVARELLHGLGGFDVPVWEGAAIPLRDPPAARADGATVVEACVNEAVEQMASSLREAPAALAALGPLTDAACLAMNAPDAAANITELLVIGGRAPGQVLGIGPRQGLSDFNLAMDEAALRYLLEQTAIPMRFMAFPLTSGALVTRAQFSSLAAREDPLAARIYADGLPWIDQWQGAFEEDGFHPWDQNAIAYLAEPALFRCAEVGWRLVTCDGSPDNDAPDNACAGHGPGQPRSLNKEDAQLWLDPVAEGGGGRPVTWCDAYADEAAEARFIEAALGGIRRSD